MLAMRLDMPARVPVLGDEIRIGRATATVTDVDMVRGVIGVTVHAEIPSGVILPVTIR